MLLQILGPLESLAAELAPMRFQGNMNSNMRSDMITLDHGYGAVTPGAGQIEVICAFATDVGIADMILPGGHHQFDIPDGARNAFLT